MLPPVAKKAEIIGGVVHGGAKQILPANGMISVKNQPTKINIGYKFYEKLDTYPINKQQQIGAERVSPCVIVNVV